MMAEGVWSSATGAGKFGSAKFPTAITVIARPSNVHNTVDPHVGQK